MALLILATLAFALLDTGTQALAHAVPVAWLVWARYAAQVLLSLAVEGPRRGRSLGHTRAPRLQALRGTLLAGLNALSVLCLQVIAVGEFTAIVMLTPLVMTLWWAHRAREGVRPLEWLTLLGGLLGALLVIQPGGGRLDAALLLALLTMIVNVAFQVVSGRLAAHDAPAITQFHTGWIGLLLSSLALPWAGMPPSGMVWTLAGLGLLCALGHQALVTAYAHARVAVLAPFLYFQIPFAVLGGWLWLDTVPDRWAALGIALVGLCGAATAWLAGRPRVRPDTVEGMTA